MNKGAARMSYLAWVCSHDSLSLDEQLAHWLTTYSYIWLVMQETVENDPMATTERWLDHHLYRGRKLWIGSQRIVEYMATTSAPPRQLAATPVPFGDAAVLTSYTLRPGRLTGYWLLDLTWQAKPADKWRFSVQALNENGQVVAQWDARPARLPGLRDQRGVDAAR